MAINPNWPVVEEAWAPALGANAGTVPADHMISMTSRSRGQTSGKRGTQYELDQVQAGEYDTTLDNRDGALDPLNSAGPWFGHINPYQPYRKRAMWPPSANLLTQFAASGGDTGAVGAIPSSAAILSGTDTTGGSVVASGTAWQGANVLQFAVPASTASGIGVAVTGQVALEPGLPYAQQLRVRNITASTTVSVQAVVVHYNASGSLVGSALGTSTAMAGSASAAWTQLTVVSTPPAGTAYSLLGIQTSAASPASATAAQVDGWQIEQAAAPTAWVQPGTWYPMFAGFTESPSAQWDMGGTYGTVPMTCVDSLALLSQVTLADPLTEEIQSHRPRFLYRLDDPAGSTAATDATGSYPSAQVRHGKDGPISGASIDFGAAITSATAGGGFTGGSDSVATFNNPNAGGSAPGSTAYLSLDSAGIMGPPSGAGWTRILAFRYTGPVPANVAELWTAYDANVGSAGSVFDLNINSSSHLALFLQGPSGFNSTFVPGTFPAVSTGDWHMTMITWDPVSGNLTFRLDGVERVFTSINTACLPSGLIMDNVGAFVNTLTHHTFSNFAGDMAFVAEFPATLTASTDRDAIYNGWKSSFVGDSTGARYARILRYVGYTGPTSIQVGLTASMGPAAEITGADALSALQSVVDTEGGAHFVARDGTITFQSRSSRYNAATPTYTFGENAAGGEWPYEDVKLPYDPTHLANTVTVTQTSTGQAFAGQDAASIAAYFPRTLTRSVNSSSALECQDAANYLVSRYKAPVVRVDALKLHPSALPGLWPVCLSLEIGMRVRVVRRPPKAPSTTVDCFIGSIQWDMDDGAEAFCTIQCTPADLNPYAIFAAWHTTLKTTIASGASSITVNASADTVNPLATQLGPGQQLVLGQNSANQETVTVSAVGATSPGWTSAVITLTAPTIKSHTAGDLINEPLPAGVTDPTTYDASALFDSVVFAY